MDTAIRGFAQRILRYFLAFLETDFKRQQVPRRRIQLKTDTGFRCGVPLRKYPRLFDAAWSLAGRRVDEGLTLRVPRSRYKAPLSPILRDLIRQHVAELQSEGFVKVREETLDFAKQHRAVIGDNPEKFVENVQLAFVEATGKRIIAPILAFLDGPFRQQSYSAIESVYEVESDLTDALTIPAIQQLPTALNTYIVKGDLDSAQAALEEFFSEQETKERIIAFFEDFATSDAFQEVRDLMNFQRAADNLQFYLYLCEIRFGTSAYPLFYIPANVHFDEAQFEYILDFDPHLFVNKRAVDYIMQEQKGESKRLPISPVEDRIVYLDESKSFLAEMDKILKKLVPVFDLAGDIDLHNKHLQNVSSPTLKMANSSYFAVFEKSDEALLNDYEELLAAVNKDQMAAGELFGNIVRSFLLDEPKSVREQIEAKWNAMPITDRLVAVSPIPINEEQRKIIAAIQDPNCRYLAIQGPPGTGKSHTITAIAFDCILNGWNILILSDKQEALDVVQDKLEATLAAVRHGGNDFPNPILRLGRIGGSYNRLISQASQEKIRQHYRAQKANTEPLQAETVKTQKGLVEDIKRIIQAYGQVTLPEVDELHRLEYEIEKEVPGYTTRLQESAKSESFSGLYQDFHAVKEEDLEARLKFISKRFPSGTLDRLLMVIGVYAAAFRVMELRQQRNALSLFTALGPQHQRTLVEFINQYEGLRMPIFGYLFKGAKLRALNTRVGEALPCANPLDLHKKVGDLKVVVGALDQIRMALEQEHLGDEQAESIYRIVLSGEELPHELADIKRFATTFVTVFGSELGNGSSLAVDGTRFPGVPQLFTFMRKACRYAVLWRKIQDTLEAVPTLDYVGTKTRLEQLYTSKMTQEIDRRFIDFVDNKRTTAKTLGGVIKAKQKFPQEEFISIKHAFPCIIAGIREFAEYMPLKQEIFDVVVIDEASQVSVAQAFPALLRAKKVVVFGDQKQFSNVKSAQASKMLNAGYLSDTEAYFRANISKAADKIQRLKQFDVKKSILEFFDLIASYSDMLRKHFRGYQELISFSSKYFYGGELQAIKVRGRPMDEVIRFTILEHDGRKERYRNVNTQEVEFILDRLRHMVEEEEGMTVGIITPFREQQQHLTRILFGDTYSDRFESELKLKIMTFDTCQGEERDVIFYSMVATPRHDVLNYVFPVDLENVEERVEEALKVQRLNVGFSRAKECVHFVLSKPAEQFRGSIGRALAHYKNLLDERPVPGPEGTDPTSPMERKVLDWVQKAKFFQKCKNRVELIPQFPIGDYLRQLDKFYQHPAYRCDFLLRYHGETRMVNIIIEYDGFAEHFIEHKKIHQGNYDQYYRPQDIERQMVIESYGYKFLRLNRFNLGQDPVETISKRLYELVDLAINHDDSKVVTKIIGEAEALSEGTVKHCRKCENLKPLKAFYDPNLRGNKGGHGQICMDCKRNKATRWSGRRWRRGW